MIAGEFDSEGKLFFEIGLVAANGEIILTNALLDTGFTDWLAMNNQDVESLGYTNLEDERPMQTAQGEALFSLYTGTVELDGQQFNIPVLAGETIDEVLLGLPWLRTRRLVVDVLAGVLTLG